MSREHIRAAESRLLEAKKAFYSKPKEEVREHLICAIRHITKVLLATRY